MAMAPNDWQLGCTEMKQRGSHLLLTGQWTDCTFLVGSDSNQVMIPGHKLILAMASPVFEAMFYGGMAERNDPIPILDVQPEAFKALLEYIYTDNINISSFDKACELCYGAKKYMLPHLVKECTRYMWSDLYPRNACRAYEFAKLFEENILMDKCLQIISTNTKEVLNDSSFEDVELNTVITVFSLEHLNVDSELDLFEAAVRYARAQDKRAERSLSPAAGPSPQPASGDKQAQQVVNIESSAENSPVAATEPGKDGDASSEPQPHSSATEHKPDDKGTKNRQGRIRSAIEKIRFLTLTPQQFAEGPARSSLLTESEAFAVLMNILSSSSDVPLPAGFSACRVPRKQLIGGGPSNMPTFTVDTPSPVTVDQVFGERPIVPQPCVLHYPRPSRFEGNSGIRLLSSVHNPSSSGVASVVNPAPTLGPMLGEGLIQEHLERSAEVSKIYCQRSTILQTDCLNTSVLDCSVTFMVDKNICLLGVQVPTQAPSEENGAGVCAGAGGGSGMYSELLYAHLLDADGARLTYTHYTNRVPYRRLLDLMFNRPVYIQRNKVYKVGIVFNKVGWYPLATCAQQVAAESVFFHFAIGQSSDSVRDGLIRSIIFTY